MDFHAATDVGRLVPADGEDEVSEVSEAKFQEWMEEQGGGGCGVG